MEVFCEHMQRWRYCSGRSAESCTLTLTLYFWGNVSWREYISWFEPGILLLYTVCALAVYTCISLEIYLPMQGLSGRATSIYSAIGQSKGVSARVLNKLSTSSKAVGSKRSSSFDPTHKCVAALQQKKKKKAVRARSTTISITALKDPKLGIPKGKRKQEIIRELRTQKVQVTHAMSCREIRNEIVRAFKHLPLTLPTPQSLRTEIPQLAKVRFQEMPMAAISGMCKGIPANHMPSDILHVIRVICVAYSWCWYLPRESSLWVSLLYLSLVYYIQYHTIS